MSVAQHWSLVAALEQRVFAVDVPKCFKMLLGNCLGNEFHNASTCLSNEFHNDVFFSSATVAVDSATSATRGH